VAAAGLRLEGFVGFSFPNEGFWMTHPLRTLFCLVAFQMAMLACPQPARAA
jgi:hypothetical protein